MPAMMRLEKVFGQDAQLFRPERFLECTEEEKIEMMRVVELCFGYGRWMCAGKVLAFVELNKIYFEVSRKHASFSAHPTWLSRPLTLVASSCCASSIGNWFIREMLGPKKRILFPHKGICGFQSPKRTILDSTLRLRICR